MRSYTVNKLMNIVDRSQALIEFRVPQELIDMAVEIDNDLDREGISEERVASIIKLAWLAAYRSEHSFAAAALNDQLNDELGED